MSHDYPFCSAAEYSDIINGEIAKCEAIVAKAKNENRDLTKEESAEIDHITDVVLPPLDEKHLRAAKVESRAMQRVKDLVEDRPPLNVDGGLSTLAPTEPIRELSDESGKLVYALNNRQKVADVHSNSREAVPYQLGEMCRAKITGDWSRIKNVMSEGTDSAGGHAVPDITMARIWDLARANMVMNQAGIQTFVTDSDNLKLAKVTADPSLETKAENAAFTGSDFTLGSVTFSPYLMGIFLKASRELAEDAPNFAQQVESMLAQSLAVQVDGKLLDGSGSSEIEGILNDTGIGQTTTAGAVAWTTFSGEVNTIRQADYMPSAFICEPAILHAVRESTDGNNLWLQAPPTLDGVQQLSTSACASGEAVVGDFSQAAVCLRHGARLEVTTEAGDSFEKHQVWMKLYVRADFSVLNASAFRRISGITAS